MAAKFGPFEKICFSDFGAFKPLCPQYVSHRHRPHYPPKHHFRKPLSPFGHLGSRQLLPQLSPPLGWPRRTHAHEPGAATATHRLGGAPTAKKALKRKNLPIDFATWSAIARDRPQWRLLAHSAPTPSAPAPNPPMPSPPTSNPPTPSQPPANLNAPLPG